MDYQAFWKEFFQQLNFNLPQLISIILSGWAAIKASSASNEVKKLNGSVQENIKETIKTYADYGGGQCPWSKLPVPKYEPKDWEKNIKVNE